MTLQPAVLHVAPCCGACRRSNNKVVGSSHSTCTGRQKPTRSRLASCPVLPSRVIIRYMYPTSRLSIPPTTMRKHSRPLRRAARPNPPTPDDARAPLIQPRTCISRFEPCEATQSGLGSALRHPAAWRLASESFIRPAGRAVWLARLFRRFVDDRAVDYYYYCWGSWGIHPYFVALAPSTRHTSFYPRSLAIVDFLLLVSLATLLS